MPPKPPSICRAATAWPACVGKPGYSTSTTRGSVEKCFAIVIADAHAIIADSALERFDSRVADELASSGGINDPLDRRTHVVALRRAVDRAMGR